MLYEPNYIVNSSFLEESIDSFRNGTIVLDLNPGNADSINMAYVAANKLPASSFFFLLLNAADTWNGKWTNEIGSFFFIPGYRKQNGSPKILVAGDDSKSLEKSIEILTEWLKSQGFAPPEIDFANSGEANSISIFDVADTEKIRANYCELLAGVAENYNNIYIRVAKKEDIDLVTELMQEEENKFRKQHNGLFLMKTNNKLLKEQLSESRLIVQAAQQEIQILSSHIDTLRSASQATHIQNYYNNEYEALPRWYKQIGHILKIFIGKRTFRSLFDNSKKKYKD